MDGLIKMVEEDRYCIDISTQLLATESILRKINKEILRAHMKCCVQESFSQGAAEQKIEELIDVIDKLAK